MSVRIAFALPLRSCVHQQAGLPLPCRAHQHAGADSRRPRLVPSAHPPSTARPRWLRARFGLCRPPPPLMRLRLLSSVSPRTRRHQRICWSSAPNARTCAVRGGGQLGHRIQRRRMGGGGIGRRLAGRAMRRTARRRHPVAIPHLLRPHSPSLLPPALRCCHVPTRARGRAPRSQSESQHGARRLFLTHIQNHPIAPNGVLLDDDAIRGMFGSAGRPVRLSFSDTPPAAPPAMGPPAGPPPPGSLPAMTGGPTPPAMTAAQSAARLTAAAANNPAVAAALAAVSKLVRARTRRRSRSRGTPAPEVP